MFRLLLATILLLICRANAQSNTPFDATGDVDVLTIEHNDTSSQKFYRFRGDNAEYDVVFNNDVTAPHRSGRYHVVGSLVTPTTIRVTEISSAATLRSQKGKRNAVTGERTVIIIRVLFSGSSFGEPASNQELTDMMFDGTTSVDGFYRFVSRDTIWFKRSKNGGSDPDIYTVSIPGGTSCFFIPGEVDKALQAHANVHMYDWNHHVLALPSLYTPCGTGVGNIGCRVGACNIWVNSLRGDVFTHELGHNFGLDHANSDYIIGHATTPQWQEYVDFSSSMSLSLDKMRRGFNPVDLDNMEVLPAGNVQTLSHPVSTLSRTVQDLYASFGTVVYKLTDHSGIVHYVSYRAGAADSYDAKLDTNMYHPLYPGTFANKVFVHREDTLAGAPSSFLEAVLEQGNDQRNVFQFSDNSWAVKFRTTTGFSAGLHIGKPEEVEAGVISSGGSSAPAVNCQVGPWGDCSVSCGTGTQTRPVWTQAANGGTACPELSRSCDAGPCPVNCVQSEWSACSVNCGIGTQTRTVITPAAHGGQACGPETQSCDAGPCPIDCVLSDWSECSATCGNGVRERTIIKHAAHGGVACGALSEPCNNGECPINCIVGSFGACSAQCGPGTKTRPVLVAAQHGGTACPPTTVECNNGPCAGDPPADKVDCAVGSWTSCSATCGGGTQTRPIVTQPQNGGAACPATSQSCNNDPCPIDCVVGAWGDCSATCGAGTQTRPIVTQPQHGGAACPSTSKTCNAGACPTPVNCAVGDWGACSATCGGGTQTRPVLVPASNGGNACPATSQSCNSQPCEPAATNPPSAVVVPGPYVPDQVYPFTSLFAPGRIQAEYFDRNGFFDSNHPNLGAKYRPEEAVDIEECLDVDGGYNVGWMRAGDWMQYTVDVKEGGNYRVEFRIASANGGGQLMLLMDDYGQVGPINIVPTNNWQNFATVQPAQVFEVSEGIHVFKVFTFTPGCNLNYFDLIKVNPGDEIPSSENGAVPDSGVPDVNFAQCGNNVCEAGEDCFTCSADCKGDVSVVQEDRYCCSGNRPIGYLTGEGWPLGDGLCEPPPANVLPSH